MRKKRNQKKQQNQKKERNETKRRKKRNQKKERNEIKRKKETKSKERKKERKKERTIENQNEYNSKLLTSDGGAVSGHELRVLFRKERERADLGEVCLRAVDVDRQAEADAELLHVGKTLLVVRTAAAHKNADAARLERAGVLLERASNALERVCREAHKNTNTLSVC